MATSSCAIQNALRIPELLEAIIIWSLHGHYIYDDRCRRVNQLRRVSKAWLVTIDQCPTLRVFAFRDPLNASSSTKINTAIFCRPYFAALEYELSAVTQIRRYSERLIGATEFKKVIRSITMTHNTVIRGFRKKRKVPRCLASDIFVTQPAVESVYIRFRGSSTEDGLHILRSLPRQKDYLRMLFHNFEYDCCIESSTGVTARDLISGLDKAIRFFYSFPKGDFEIQKIEIWINSQGQLNKNPQFVPGWQIRKLWDSRPWKS